VTWVRLRAVEIGCLALGVAILAITVWTIGAQALIGDLRTMGWSLAGLLMVESLSVLMNTAGWAMAFPAGERPVSAARLLGARLAGDAVNTPTPSATVGGDFRVRLLGPDVAPSPMASVSAAKIGQSVAQAVFSASVAIVVPDQAVTAGGRAPERSSWLCSRGPVPSRPRWCSSGPWTEASGRWRDTLRWIKSLALAGLVGRRHDVDAALARVTMAIGRLARMLRRRVDRRRTGDLPNSARSASRVG
jgi:hypothetical protein